MQHMSGKKRCTKSSPDIGWANLCIFVIIGGVLPRRIDWTSIYFCNKEKRSEMKLKLLNWWKGSKGWNSDEDWLDIEKECTAVLRLRLIQKPCKGFHKNLWYKAFHENWPNNLQCFIHPSHGFTFFHLQEPTTLKTITQENIYWKIANHIPSCQLQVM